MATTYSYGSVPAPVLDTAHIEGLFGERVAQRRQWQLATTLAPIKSVAGHKGEYPIDTAWRGVNLQDHPTAGTAVDNYATEYPKVRSSFSTIEYEIERYLIDEFAVSNNEAAKFASIDGHSIEDYVLDRIADKAAALHYKLVIDSLTNTANYATGYQYDPGNLTTLSTKMTTLLDTMRGKLLDSQSWDLGEPIIVWAAEDVIPYLQQNAEIQQSVTIGQSNDVVPTIGMLQSFFQQYLSDRAVFVPLSGRYTNASGTVTKIATAQMGFVVPPTGNRKYGAATLMPGDGTGKVVDVRTEENQRYGGGGHDIFADAYYKVERPSYNSGNDAAILWTGVLS